QSRIPHKVRRGSFHSNPAVWLAERSVSDGPTNGIWRWEDRRTPAIAAFDLYRSRPPCDPCMPPRPQTLLPHRLTSFFPGAVRVIHQAHVPVESAGRRRTHSTTPPLPAN